MNKKISILGDSISSYNGYSNNNNYNSTLSINSTYYKTSMDKSDLESVNDTYWMLTANALSLEVCVPNGCGASRVTDTVRLSYPDTVIPSAPERAHALHRDGENEMYPDIIAVLIGTNDVGNHISLELFKTDYDKLLTDILNTYKNAKLYVGTLIPQGRKVTPEENDGYNSAIREIAKKHGVTVVDYAKDSGITWDNYLEHTADSLHPNKAGMKKLADCLISVLGRDLGLN